MCTKCTSTCLCTGVPIAQVLVCEKLELLNEFYFAIVLDRAFMVCAHYTPCTLCISPAHVHVYMYMYVCLASGSGSDCQSIWWS